MKKQKSIRGSGISARALIEPMEVRQLLSSAGKLDTSFSGDGVTTLPTGVPSSSFFAVAVQSDGKVVATGATDDDAHGQRLLLTRFKKDGSLDTGFASGGKLILGNQTIGVSIAITSDGKIVVGGGDHVYRFTSSGKLDTSFSGDGVANLPSQVQSVAVRSDGKVIVGMDSKVWRLLSNGSQDKAFGYGGSFTATSHTTDTSFSLSKVLRLSDGSILVYGSAEAKTGPQHNLLVKLDSGGHLDTNFGSGKGYIDYGPASDEYTRTLAVGPNGKIVTLSTIGDEGDFLYRINANGTLDTTFSSKNGRPAIVNDETDVAVDSSNRILECGSMFLSDGEHQQLAVARLKSDGSTDTSFGSGGISKFNFGSTNISSSLYETIGSDGKIIVAGAQQTDAGDVILAGVGRLKSS